MADAPILGFRSSRINVARGLLAFWVLCAHLFAWSGALNQGSVVLAATFERLGRLFQSNGETHPAVLGFIPSARLTFLKSPIAKIDRPIARFR